MAEMLPIGYELWYLTPGVGLATRFWLYTSLDVALEEAVEEFPDLITWNVYVVKVERSAF